MDFNEYQNLASRTGYGDNAERNFVLMIYSMGLAGESGEVIEKLKKAMRDRGGAVDEGEKQLLQKELGDVLWYLSEISRMLGIPLQDIAQMNIEKLASRKERGTLHGAGDTR
jgi:NTP pyrophosphatase (non-canonical NTP hydrolase)